MAEPEARTSAGNGVSRDVTAPAVTVLFLIRDPGDREVRTAEMIRKQNYEGRVYVDTIDSSPDPDRPNNRKIEAMSDAYETIPAESFRHGATRNRGAERCSDPIFVCLSSDATPVDDRWLTALVRPIAAGEAEVSYGRQKSPVADAEREATFASWYPDEPCVKSKDQIAELGIRAFIFTDVSSAYRTDVIQKIPFPELSIFQDMGMIKALMDAGCRIAYVPDAEVWHVHQLVLKTMWHRYRGLGEVCERVGIFDDVKANRKGGLVVEGWRAVRSIVPSMKGGPKNAARSFGMSVVKAAAIQMGRRDAHRRPPLELEWTPELGSRAVRK